MTRKMQAVQLALRERRRAFVLISIWSLVTVICAISGPFGTHDVLSLPARFGYWGVIAAASVLSVLIPDRSSGLSDLGLVVLWIIYVLSLSGLIIVLNFVLFEVWFDRAAYAYLVTVVGVIVLAVHAALWLIDFARPAAETPDVDPQTRFLRRLPLALRAPLVRIEAQDHYLNVVTAKGSSLILLRLGEAVQELEGAGGVLVHRSHWVACAAVQVHRRENGRDILVMSDGAEIPVSRSNRAAAQAAGLF